MDLTLFTIIPLDTEHIDEICLDIEQQYRSGVANCVLFMMTLVPEGNPPLDKVGTYCRKYELFRDRLKAKGLKSGVLVQATIGHGWILSEMFPYQPYTALETGEEKQIVCPLDKGFGQYVKNVFTRIAKCSPDFIMLDDDFRLLSCRAGGGCCCPLHVAKFNEEAGTDFSREQIWAALHQDGVDGDRYNAVFEKINHDALVNCARLMREGIDEVNPKIPGAFCCVGNNAECAADIAEIMSGKGNPVVLRINNGAYCSGTARFFSNVSIRAAQQIAKVKDRVDIILDESDTYPQNRYSTSAAELHAHFTAGLLEGVKGAKHWLSRLESFEPQSGIVYRKTLSKFAGFYRALADIVSECRWLGFRIPLSEKSCFDFRRDNTGESTWLSRMLDKFGLPVYLSAENGGIACFEGDEIGGYSDEKIKEILSENVFLASDSAKILCDRGFSEYLGVNLRQWKGEVPTYERIYATGQGCERQNKLLEICPTDKNVKIHSIMCHDILGMNVSELYPGVTEYKNSLGGTAVVFCGTPNAPFNITTSFGYLNWSRKEQVTGIAKRLGALPIYYPADGQIYLKAAEYRDGLICAIFNIGFDVFEDIPLCIERAVSGISYLDENGTFVPLEYTEKDGVYTVKREIAPLIPTILFIR